MQKKKIIEYSSVFAFKRNCHKSKRNVKIYLHLLERGRSEGSLEVEVEGKEKGGRERWVKVRSSRDRREEEEEEGEQEE